VRLVNEIKHIILDAAWKVVQSRHMRLGLQQDFASINISTDLHIKQQSIAPRHSKRTEHTIDRNEKS
jgi:hypothetical protein